MPSASWAATGSLTAPSRASTSRSTPEHVGLDLAGVGDDTAPHDGGGARHAGQGGADQPPGQRLGGADRQVELAQQRHDRVGHPAGLAHDPLRRWRAAAARSARSARLRTARSLVRRSRSAWLR